MSENGPNLTVIAICLWFLALIVALIGCLVEGETVGFFVILVGWLGFSAFFAALAAMDDF